jgi:hypothetical protein
VTTADKLTYLATTKIQIHDAIVAKGVTIPVDSTFRSYATYISQISGGGGVEGYNRAYILGGHDGASYMDDVTTYNCLLRTATALSTTLNSSRTDATGFSNENYAFVLGGYNAGGLQDGMRVSWVTNVRNTLSLTLLDAHTMAVAAIQFSDVGFLAGGKKKTGANNDAVSTISNFTFATEVESAITATLMKSIYLGCGLRCDDTKGYRVGGYHPYSVLQTNDLDKLTKATETTSTITATYDGCSWCPQSISVDGDKAYFNKGSSTSMTKFSFSIETISSVSVSLSGVPAQAACISKGSEGHIVGGTGMGTGVNIVDMTTDTVTAVASVLSGTTNRSVGQTFNQFS